MQRRPMRRGDRGAEAVEFALIVPVLLALVAALIAFAFLLMSQITITQAAREGARFAAICNTDTSCLGSGWANVKSDVTSHAPGITIDPADIVVSDCTAPGATNATVTITYRRAVTILFGPDLGSLTLKARSSTPCSG
jgi:Flp pilus assembly protein TadG